MNRVNKSSLFTAALGVVVCFIMSMGVAIAQTDATGDQTDVKIDRSYIGQPVVDDSKMPSAGRDFTSKDGYTAQRIVTGLQNPVALAVDENGTLYVAEERTVSTKPLRIEDDIIRISTDGTAKYIREGIQGPVNGIAYFNRSIYLAIGTNPGEIRRMNAWTGRSSRVFSFANNGRYRSIMDVVQKPGSRTLNLVGIEYGGSAWQLMQQGSGWMASTTSPKPAAFPTRIMGFSWLGVIVSLVVILGLAILVMRWTNRDRV